MNDVDTYMPALDDPDGHASAVAEFTFARRSRRLGAIGAALAIFFLWFGLPAIRNAAPPTPTAQTAAHSAALNSVAHHTGPPAKRIEDIQLGDRVAGRNPHREEVELVEPDEESWREVRLRLKKDDGGLLWINLLRPIEWLEIQEAKVGGEIFLDLPEMGAIGDAEVQEILPCPNIDAGHGAVVTGQFRHEVTNGEIVELRLAGQTTPTRVTANHPYWSVDRNDFIPASDLKVGERLDTLDGDLGIASLTRVPYSGLLYNLETTEHVYRVADFGTLVHNSYLSDNLRRAGKYGDAGAEAHHIVALAHRAAKPARGILAKHGIGINGAINGIWLPQNALASRARGALHRQVGSALTNSTYLNEVNRRIVAADAQGGRAYVLRELQRIANDLLNGTFPGSRPNF